MRLFIISHIEPTADLTMSFTLFLFFSSKIWFTPLETSTTQIRTHVRHNDERHRQRLTQTKKSFKYMLNQSYAKTLSIALPQRLLIYKLK